MSTVGGISLSGMNAAMRQLDASAENIANARSSGPMPDAANASGHPAVFTPLDVEQTPNANGGVSVRIAASTRQAIAAYDPNATYANADGMVATPNVDLTDEMVQLASANHAFAANLAVARTDDDMWASLLSIKT